MDTIPTPPGTALSFWTLTSPGTLTPPSVQSFFLLNMAILPRSNSRESRVSRRVVEPSIRSAQIARLLPSEDPLRPAPGKKNAPSFLFEVKVLLALLSALRADGWNTEPIKRNGRLRLVSSPAPKATGSYFRYHARGHCPSPDTGNAGQGSSWGTSRAGHLPAARRCYRRSDV
jgi:hypothetical protein